MADRAGQRLGNYRVIGLIGRGAFADVYLGEHIYLKTQVAIKVLRTLVTNQEDLDSFLKEAQTVAHLVHPSIIRITDFGVEDGIPFLVMDYAPNGTLRQRHPKGTRVPLHVVVPYVKQIAAALQHAHDEKLIHRDVKPENMLLGRRNEVLLSDFGIALIAQSTHQSMQEMAGTASYMAPEQIQGKARPASDQYSLAVVVYEWLSGDRPFHGSLTEIVSQHVLAAPPALREKVPAISPAVEEVILTALAKDPSRRFKSVTAFANALEQASRLEESRDSSSLAGSPASTLPVEPPAGGSSHVTQVAEASSSSVQSEPASPSSASPTVTPSSPGSRAELSSSKPDLHRPAIEPLAGSGSPISAQMSPVVETPGEKNELSESGNERLAARLVGRIGAPQVVAVVLGMLLYGGFTYLINSLYKASSPLVTSQLSLLGQSIDTGIMLAGIALIVPLFLAAIAGPLAGFITATAGLYLGNLLAGYSAISDYYAASWTSFAGIILTGVIAGLAALGTRGRYNSARSIAIAIGMSIIAIIVGTAFTSFGNIWVSGYTISEAWTIFLILASPVIIDPVLLLILLLAYNVITSRRQ